MHFPRKANENKNIKYIYTHYFLVNSSKKVIKVILILVKTTENNNNFSVFY